MYAGGFCGNDTPPTTSNHQSKHRVALKCALAQRHPHPHAFTHPSRAQDSDKMQPDFDDLSDNDSDNVSFCFLFSLDVFVCVDISSGLCKNPGAFWWLL
jgi:hypothetical protein